MKNLLTLSLVSLALAGSVHAQTVPATSPPSTSASTTGSTALQDPQGNTVTITSHHPTPPARDHRAQFDVIDGDRDGVVSRREATVDKYLVRAFATLDGDRDGRLAYEEMLRWLDD